MKSCIRRSRLGCSSKSSIYSGRLASSSAVARTPARAAMRFNIPQEDLEQIQHERTKSHPDPGPDSQTMRLVAEKSPYMVTTYARNPLALVRGEGCKVWDLEGREYIDFNAGIAVSAMGHGDMDIAQVIFDQARQLIHSSNLFHSPWSWELAKLLVETTKSSGGMADAAKVFFANSGTEANEAAIKFARKHGQVMETEERHRRHGGSQDGDTAPRGNKYKIMTFRNAFHGRTMGALSATANEKYQAPFRPMVPGFEYAAFNDVSAIDALDDSFCGVMVEPVQGEGGIFAASEEFLLALRQKCDAIGAVLIYDEIQCGLGRSGKVWAHSWFSPATHPDIMTMAKPLANGVPIGATMVTQKVADAIIVGDHGTTFGGNPLACRVGHHVFSRLSSPTLLANVQAQSQRCLAALHAIQAEHPERVKDVRGRGLLLGIELDADPSPIIKFARERGLLLITAGNNTIRMVPPLIIDGETVDAAMRILTESVREFVQTSSSRDANLSPNRPKEATG